MILEFLFLASVTAPATADKTFVKYENNVVVRFDSLNRLRSLREPSGATRWIARDIAGRAQAETTLNLLGAAQAARIHHNDGYRRIATDQASGPKRFVYGRGLDELLFQEKGSGQLSPVVSQLGSTMKLLDAAGGITDQFRYDAFGAPLTGDSAAFSHLFAGAIYDHKAKLYDLRHRHYDPKIGRFLSRDPLGAHADPVNAGNAYAYVGNNPLNRRDPLGLLTGDGFLQWLDQKAQWLNQKAWDATQGVGLGVEMLAAGAWEGLQETKRTFDDLMCFGLPNDARSQIGQKIQGYTESGDSLPEAIGLAVVDTTVETAQGLHAAASALGTAVSNGDVKTATAIVTGVGAGILIPGPDEIITINALRSAAGANATARTISHVSEGPGDAKRCMPEKGMEGSESVPDPPLNLRKRWEDKGDGSRGSNSGGSNLPPHPPYGPSFGDDFGDLPGMIQKFLDEGPSSITGISMVDACELWLTIKDIRNEIGAVYGPFSYQEMYMFMQAIERFHKRRGPPSGGGMSGEWS